MSYSWGAGRTAAPEDGFPATPVLPGLNPATGIGGAGPITEMSSDLVMRRLAAELAPMVGVWQRLMAEHVPNRSGRCLTCTKGGTGLPSVPWPCSLYGIAEMARRRYDSGGC